RERRLGPRTARHRTTGRSTRLRVHGSPNPTWSYLSHSCASKGKGAMAVTASPERFRQEDAAGARWISRNGPENAVSVALLATGRLEADRVEERRRAAAPARLVLGELEEAAADATPPELLRQEEQVDEEDAERGMAGDAAERRVRLRVTCDDVEHPAIRDPALLPVVAPQAVGDHLLGGRVARV